MLTRTFVKARTKEIFEFIGTILLAAFMFFGMYCALHNAHRDREKAAALAAEHEARKVELQSVIADNEQKKQELDSLISDIAAIESEMFNSPQAVGVILTTRDLNAVAKLVWGEGRGVSKLEQSMIVWCVLNHVDAGYGSVYECATNVEQFHGYDPKHPVNDDIINLVKDVVARWQLEKVCVGDVGRTLPSDYLWFYGDGDHNWFRNAYQGGDTWDWTNVHNPYA